MLVLAGKSVDDVRSGEYTYDDVTGMILNFQFGDQYGVEYYGDTVKYEKITIDKEVSLEGINGRVLDMTLDIDASKAEEFEIKFAKNNEYETIIRYYSKRNTIEFDRSYSGKYGDILHKREMKVKDNDGKLRMRLVLDKYSAEIFANDGEQVMTSTFYTPLDAQDITLSSKGKSILSIEKHKIDI